MQTILLMKLRLNLATIWHRRAGQTITWERFGKPIARIMPLECQQPKSWIGAMKGQFHISEEDWEASEKLMAKDWDVWLDGTSMLADTHILIWALEGQRGGMWP